MPTTKAPKGKIVFQEDATDVSEREARRNELKAKFPNGYCWIQPVCDHKEFVSDSQPRAEDHWKPRCTVIKVPISIHRGTHPQTGLPKYDDTLVKIDLIDPQLKWPVDVRSDLVKGLGPKVIDPWELLDFLDSFPGQNNLFRLLPGDPLIDGRIKAGLRTKGAKAALHEVMRGQKEEAGKRRTESIPERRVKDRTAGGQSFDEGITEAGEEDYLPSAVAETAD